jgi:Tfp pilus assembly protein PilN
MPPGFAPLAEVETRIQPLLSAGCRSTSLRYAGDAVIIAGEADEMRCVSNTLRAIDGVVSPSGPRVELLQIAADAAGHYRFEIRLPASSLTQAG